MNVWHLAFRVDSLTYTVAKALSHGGHGVNVWVVAPEQDYGLSEGIYRALRETPRVGFVGKDEGRLPTVIDRLIVQSHPRTPDSTRDAPLLAKRARKITLISAGDRNRSRRDMVKLQWLEARRLWRHLGRVDRILYKDGFHPHDLFAPFKRRSNLGFDVHSQFLHSDELFRAIHAQDWDPEDGRPILVNFLGCRDPDVRARILDEVRPVFQRKEIASPGGRDKRTLWHEYTNASPVGLDPREFLKVLSTSDFTLCPRGYSLVTHRPVEALLRGSIPVLSSNELDLYGIELRDRENCIAVADGRWPETVRDLAQIDERQLIQMRGRVRAMFDASLSYDAIARRLRSCLGVEDPERGSVQLARPPGAAPVF
jgi:hypothetical protein